MTEIRLYVSINWLIELVKPRVWLDLGSPHHAVRALSHQLSSLVFFAGWFYFFLAEAWQLYTYVLT